MAWRVRVIRMMLAMFLAISLHRLVGAASVAAAPRCRARDAFDPID